MRKCSHCDQSFTPRKGWQVTCSPPCGRARNNERRRADCTVKRCRTCGQDRPIGLFVLNHTSCRECEQLRSEGRKRCQGCSEIKTRDEFHARRNADGRESICKVCSASRSQARNARPDVRRSSQAAKRLARYGISPERYEQLLTKQGGQCAICGQQDHRGRGAFCVDHDHVTGAVRGLLCMPCNSLLGQAGDDLDVLRAAVNYLERHHHDQVVGA